jgi:hypothetical protein
MKRTILILSLIVCVTLLFGEIMHSANSKRAMKATGKEFILGEMSRETPEWEFVATPTELLTSYYDYMPGSYSSIPIRVQPQIPVDPGTWPGGGVYMVYHGQETPTAERRLYYSYIDADGNVITQGTPINSSIVREGYPSIDIDSATGNPLAAWHSDVSGDPLFEIVFTYDLYNWIGGPGLWISPPTEIIVPGGDYCPSPDDEFNWPYVYTCESPLDSYRRVFVSSENYTDSPSGNPSENVLVAYADYNTADMDAQEGLSWNHYSIPLLDDWHNEIPEWYRPFKSFAVTEDGQSTAYAGYKINDSQTYFSETDFFVLLNDTFGEGDYEYYFQNFQLSVENPLSQTGEATFTTTNGDPYELYFSFQLSNHFNTIFFDNDSKIMFNGAMGLQGYDPENVDDQVYWPYAIYPKIFIFDVETHDFSFVDLDLTGANATDDNPMLPWDLDEDGFVDSFDDEGNVEWYSGYTIYTPDTDGAGFEENHFKLVKNEENGWLAAIWYDGLKAKYADEGIEGYENWAETPEIAMSLYSAEKGVWSETILMNANPDDDNYVAEFDGMIPVYLYPGDVIEDLGDGHGKLHMMFLDDNSFGSSIQGTGNNNGGTMMYASIDLDFDYPVGAGSENVPTPEPVALSQNYPNPFNPTTTIDFQVKTPGKVEIEVYNIKGAKVKTLINTFLTSGNHSITWNGTDVQNNEVSSGMYFYKLKTENKYTSTKKMLLLK